MSTGRALEINESEVFNFYQVSLILLKLFIITFIFISLGIFLENSAAGISMIY